MGLILFLIAFILLIPTILVSFVYVWIKYKTPKGYFLSLAIDIDIFGNRAFRSLWNSWFIKSNGYQFGSWGETMSSVFGKNQRDNTLTTSGKVIAWILDHVEKEHCKKSITEI